MEDKKIKPCCLMCGKEDLSEWAKARDVEYFTSMEEYTYYQCFSCKSLSIHPIPEAFLSVIYPTNYYSYNDQGSKTLAEKIKGILDRRLFKKILTSISNKSISVLDVGGGSGWLLDEIKVVDNRVSFTQVVDIDPKAEQIALQKGHKFFLGKIEDFSPEEKFDVVLILNLIEHVKDPLLLLEKIRGMLKKDGKILVKTPNWESLDSFIFRKTYWNGLHAPRHWVLFNEESFKKLVARANLKIIKFKYTQGAPFWSGSVLYNFYKKGLIKLDQKKPMIYHPLFKYLILFFAAFDFIRLPFSKTSQMFIILSHDN